MKRRISQIVICCLSLFAVLTETPAAQADHYRTLYRLARRIDSTAASIAREAQYYVSSPHYVCLVTETSQLRQLACHVRDTAREGCDLLHLQQAVTALGAAYRNLDAKICLIEQAHPGCHRARRMRRLLSYIHSDISDMISCLRQLLTPPCPSSFGVPRYGYQPVPSNPGWGYRYGYGSLDYQEHHYGSGYDYGIHNYTRYPNHTPYSNQGGLNSYPLQRSAELESQLRSLRSGSGPTISLGGGRITLSF